MAISQREVPCVSVGMPVFNGQSHIENAISSILEQSIGDLELVISDNASTDSTWQICEQFAARDDRIRLLRNSSNLGLCANYRMVARAARGRYFKWASANDFVAPDFVEQCVSVLDRRPDVVLAFGQTDLFDRDPCDARPYAERLDVTDEDPVDRLRMCLQGLRLNNAINGVMRTDELRRTAVMPDYLSSDSIVLAQLALAGKVVMVPTVRFYRRLNPESAVCLLSPRDRLMRHYPTADFKQLFQDLQWTQGLLAAVLRARLTLPQRARALSLVARYAYWRAPGIGTEFIDAARFVRSKISI